MQNSKCKISFPLSNLKIVNDEIICVRGQGAKAEHTLRYVSISLSAGSCKKNSSEQFLHKKIVNDEIIFVDNGAKIAYERGNFVQG